MEFQRHLFISYAHIDNVPLTEHQQGWISRFHDTLSAMLGMRIGRKAEIWRDANSPATISSPTKSSSNSPGLSYSYPS